MPASDVPITRDGHAVVAFSGGLGTSYCVAWLRREVGCRVTAVTIDTGGFDEADLERIAARSRELGAEHVLVDGRQRVYDDHVAWLIRGNVLRGAIYPLCVGAERVVQGREVGQAAAELGAGIVVHGYSGSGNDQVRFEMVFAALYPHLRTWSLRRDQDLSREQITAWLRNEGVPVPDKSRDYSVSAGIWGLTIGGSEIHDPWAYPSGAAWASTTDPSKASSWGQQMVIGFERGLPVSLNGAEMAPLELLEAVRATAATHGVGRGIHLGDTILGIKGRIAFEAPAPAVLVPAHRELEKLVLSAAQRRLKDRLGEAYGTMLHEGRYFDPVMRDIEAFLASSQERVTGDVRVLVRQGLVEVRGVRSPYSMVLPELARYGEQTALWDGRDAQGFSRIFGTQQLLSGLAGKRRRGD